MKRLNPAVPLWLSHCRTPPYSTSGGAKMWGLVTPMEPLLSAIGDIIAGRDFVLLLHASLIVGDMLWFEL